MEKKKYIFLNTLMGFGGLEIQMMKRAEDAISLGHSVLMIVLKDSKIIRYCKRENIPYESINIRINYIDLFAGIKIGKIFKQFCPDYCIVGKTNLLSLAVFARNLYFKKSKIILYQQMQSGVNKKDFFHNWIYRNLDGAIVIANFMKNQLSETTIFPFDKIVKIPYGIKTEHFSRKNFDKALLKKQYGLPDNAFVIGTVGRIEPHKDQMTTINSFASADLPCSYLFFVGNVDNEAYYNEINKRINELNIQQRVKFLDFTDNISEIMNLFDIFVLSSLSETLGLVVLEAMSAGLAVVATKSGGVVEVIKDNLSGLFFEPRDQEKLTEHLRRVHNDVGFRMLLSENAEKFAQETYDYNKLTRNFFDFCENC